MTEKSNKRSIYKRKTQKSKNKLVSNLLIVLNVLYKLQIKCLK